MKVNTQSHLYVVVHSSISCQFFGLFSHESAVVPPATATHVLFPLRREEERSAADHRKLNPPPRPHHTDQRYEMRAIITYVHEQRDVREAKLNRY